MDNSSTASFATETLSSLRSRLASAPRPIVYAFSCGYEARSTYLLDNLQSLLGVESTDISFCCLSFTTFRDSGSRLENDAKVLQQGITPINLEPTDWKSAVDAVRATLRSAALEEASLLIDYSSMPRNWYCQLVLAALNGEFGTDVSFIYAHSEYFEDPFPCVGYGEFRRFSGRPRVASLSEVNVFGLGFDSTRTFGIWTHLDPQASISIISTTEKNSHHCARVNDENSELIDASLSLFELRIDDFETLFASIVDIARIYSEYGDVALVPDGPKPLVLAMSLTPRYLGLPGVYCWHVGHVKPREYSPIDVRCSGEVFGFSLRF